MINSGDTAWILISSALVMLMTPGLAFFYGGMVRRKNFLSTIMMSFACLAVVGVLWVLFGYSLAFGPDHGGIIGGLDWLGLNGVGEAPSAVYATTVPHLAFVYVPVAHWVWGTGGWLAKMGALDFAGGTVVHVNAGVSAMALALLLGPRKGFKEGHPMEPNNIPLVILGAGLLWFGWFGFNAGSALTAGGLAANAFVTTNTAAAAAAFAWMIVSWVNKRPSALGTATGAVVGLVAITPAAGYVTPLAAIVIGAAAAVISYYVMIFRMKRGVDESLDVWACHGIGGTFGALGVVWVFSFGMTLLLGKLVDKTIGLRVSPTEEIIGLDIAQHGETAYGGLMR
jgi:Amt family ammonium transporter